MSSMDEAIRAAMRRNILTNPETANDDIRAAARSNTITTTDPIPPAHQTFNDWVRRATGRGNYDATK